MKLKNARLSEDDAKTLYFNAMVQIRGSCGGTLGADCGPENKCSDGLKCLQARYMIDIHMIYTCSMNSPGTGAVAEVQKKRIAIFTYEQKLFQSACPKDQHKHLTYDM